jgi:hypothetical protein
MAARRKPARSLIESSPDRPLIERALAMGVSMQAIARRFGFSAKAITRYRDRMPQQLRASILAASLRPKEADLDQLRIDESEGILGNLAHQRARLLMGQDEAMEAGAIELMGSLSRVIHQNISLTGKYLGLFAQHHVSSQVNILLSEDYLRLRQALIMALKPFPEARRAVAEEIHRIEGETAQKMLAQAAANPPRPTLARVTIDAELPASNGEMVPPASPQPAGGAFQRRAP